MFAETNNLPEEHPDTFVPDLSQRSDSFIHSTKLAPVLKNILICGRSRRRNQRLIWRKLFHLFVTVDQGRKFGMEAMS